MTVASRMLIRRPTLWNDAHDNSASVEPSGDCGSATGGELFKFLDGEFGS